MRSINPTWKHNCSVQREAQSSEISKSRKKLRRVAAKKYMQSEHEYMLLNGDDKTGITRKMLGRDAKKQNQLNVLKFGGGKSKKLMRWVVIGENLQDPNFNHGRNK